jgi:hypothetical protein
MEKMFEIVHVSKNQLFKRHAIFDRNITTVEFCNCEQFVLNVGG